MRTIAGLVDFLQADVSGDPILPGSGHGTRNGRIVIDPVPAARVRVLGEGCPAAALRVIRLVRPVEMGGKAPFHCRHLPNKVQNSSGLSSIVGH